MAGRRCSRYGMGMTPKNRAELANRVAKAAHAALAARHYVSAIDVLVGIGWLDPSGVDRWRRGQVDYLERIVQSNLSRISEAMRLFRAWGAASGLTARETAYIARAQRRELRFSKSGNPTIERLYRTHWVAPELRKVRRARPTEEPGRPPDLGVEDA